MHVLDSHPEMEDAEVEVKQVIENPSYSMIYQDRDYPERNIYYRKQNKNYFIKAVVEFMRDDHGELITAFMTDSPKSGEALLWMPG